MKEKIHYNNIKGVLGTRGISVNQLAEGMKVAQATASRWCTNDMQPSIIKLYEIANVIGVPATDLIFPTPQIFPDPKPLPKKKK